MIDFKNLRQFFWPIRNEEIKFFVPMALLMATVLFNLGLLKSLKDSLIVASIGAEAISFLKMYIVLPIAVIFTFIYVGLSNKFPLQKVFYIIIVVFIFIFFLFGFVFFPEYERYHISVFKQDQLIKMYPLGKWLILLFAKWSYVLIYIIAELWSVVVINLMFWQYANNYLDTAQAKRFYPFLSMIGNLGLFAAGNTLIYCTNCYNFTPTIRAYFKIEESAEDVITIQLVISVIIFACILAIFLMRYITYILSTTHITTNKKSPKLKLSLIQSIMLVIRSKYIRYITLLVICYGLAINVIESSWKSKVRSFYPSIKEYIYFMGHFNIWIGISCVLFTLLSSFLLRQYRWKYLALATPLLIGISGGIFFGLVVFLNQNNSIIVEPLLYAVIVGAFQNIISKSTKYTLFDVSKEMTYIPLDQELKIKGKAAVEIVGSKFGKSLGAGIQVLLFTLDPFATFDSISHILMIIFIIIICIWLMTIGKLEKEYNKLV